jgi:hypothetical protein
MRNDNQHHKREEEKFTLATLRNSGGNTGVGLSGIFLERPEDHLLF